MGFNSVVNAESKSDNFKLTKKFAEEGRVFAQYHLAIMYSKGIHIDKNLYNAFYWFNIAASNGHTEAQIETAIMYDNGHGINQDTSKAIHFYNLASQDNTNKSNYASSALYLIHSEINSPHYNIELATKWSEISQTSQWLENYQTQIKIPPLEGCIVFQMCNFSIDYKSLFRLSKLNTDSGNLTYLLFIGEMYEKGAIVLQNFTKAHMWYSIAASKGSSMASEERDRISKIMTPQQIHQSQVAASQCALHNFKNCHDF